MNEAMADHNPQSAAAITPAVGGIVADRPRPWPAVAALATAWICPATTAAHTQHVPLWAAFLVHLTALALIPFAVGIGWSLSTGSADDALRALNELPEGLATMPAEALLAMGVMLTLLQLGLLVLAILFMPWGAVDERFRGSLKHTLRRVWLQTAQLPVIVFIIWFIFGTVELMRQGYSPGYGFSSYSRRPWYVQEDVVAAWLLPMLGLWWLWALFRSVGVKRAYPPVERPPGCEFCGYNLTLSNPQGNCPECGEPVRSSLGPDVRPGAPWEHRATLGTWKAYGQTCRLALFQPSRLGHMIHSIPAGAHHHRFLLIHLAVIGLLCYPCVLWLYRVGTGEDLNFEERSVREFVWIMAPVGTGLVVAGSLGITSLAALSAGWRSRNEFRRNLLSAAAQIVAYQSVTLVIGLLYGTLTMTLVLWALRNRVFRDFFRRWHFDDEAAVAMIWCSLILLYAAWVGAIALRGTRAARFANH